MCDSSHHSSLDFHPDLSDLVDTVPVRGHPILIICRGLSIAVSTGPEIDSVHWKSSRTDEF